eukprot:6495420-Alexandrium_andersonii.AAC.1
MSASLVGSEMCIRDRSFRPMILKPGFGQLPNLPTKLACGYVGGPSRGPVSYTHLTLPTICSV